MTERRRTRVVRSLLLAIGAHGFVAQVVLLREFMAAFAGNELTAGVGIGIWIAAEALGAWIFSRVPVRNVEIWLDLLVPISALTSTTAVALVALGCPLLGMLPGQVAGVHEFALVALVAVAIPSATHGALFVLGTSTLVHNNPEGRVGPGYVWEGVGALLAAAAFILLLPHLPSLALVGGTGIAVLIIRAMLSRRPAGSITAVGLGLALAACVAVAPEIERAVWTRYWLGQEVVAVHESHYGKTLLLQDGDQQLLATGGEIALAEPDLDVAATEELALVPLLAHPDPRRVLVVGPGFGLLPVIARYPVESVDLVTIDPVPVRTAQDMAGPGLSRALTDPHTNIIVQDPRLYLAEGHRQYDCIVIFGDAPTSLGTNRLFTWQFYRYCRARLNVDGLLFMRAPGSAVGASAPTRQLLDIRTATLRSVFPHVAVLALDFPAFIAGRRELTVDPDVLAGRLFERMRKTPHRQPGARPSVLTPDYLRSLFDRFRQRSLSIQGDPDVPINSDARPIEFLTNLALAEGATSRTSARIIAALGRARPVFFAAAGLLLLLVVLSVTLLRSSTGARTRFARPYGIATSGFAAAAISTLSVLSYQTRFGSVYSAIGILLASFTLGTVIGGTLGDFAAGRRRFLRSLFIGAESALVLAGMVLSLLSRTPGAAPWIRLGFLATLLATGGAVGVEFPLAANALLHGRSGRTTSLPYRAGLLTALDLSGGFFGATTSALVLLPGLGVTASCVAVAGLKTTSLLGQLLASGRNRTVPPRV